MKSIKSKSTHILYIVDPVDYGGSEKYLLGLLEYFNDIAKVKVLVIGDNSLEFEERLSKLKVNTIRIKDPSLKSIIVLARVLWRHRHYVWHLNLSYYDSCRYVQLIARVIPSVKVVATLHSLPEPNSLPWWKMPKRKLRGSVFNRINTLISPSNYVAAKLYKERNFPKHKIQVIYNGAPATRLKNYTLKRNNTKRVPRIICAARLHQLKGQKYLIDALAMLRKNKYDFKCVLVGDGPEKDELQKMVARLSLSSNVEFLGFRKDTIELIEGSDIFVLPTLFENFPIVILEAMSVGKPIVASRVGGIPEQIFDDKTGKLVEAGNARELSVAIEYMIDNPETAQQMGENASKYFQKHFTIDIMLASIKKVYLD